MLDRKGHVGTFLLLVGAIVLVIAAWFSLLTLGNKISGESRGFAQLSSDSGFDREYVERVFELVAKESALKSSDVESFRNNFILISANIEKVHGVEGNFFGLIRNGNLEVEIVEGRYIVELRGVELTNSVGYASVEQEFDLYEEVVKGL